MRKRSFKEIQRFIRILLVGGALTSSVVLGTATSLTGQGRPAPAYQIKAAFLYNFTRFVEWPDDAYLSPDAPFIIGVIGNSDLEGFLGQLVHAETIGGHRIVVQHYRHVRDIKDCNILFIGTGELPNVRNSLSSLHKRDILTVSDSSAFLRMGGMVRFYTERNKIRIEINMASAQSSRLKISSKLLSIATIYNRS